MCVCLRVAGPLSLILSGLHRESPTLLVIFVAQFHFVFNSRDSQQSYFYCHRAKAVSRRVSNLRFTTGGWSAFVQHTTLFTIFYLCVIRRLPCIRSPALTAFLCATINRHLRKIRYHTRNTSTATTTDFLCAGKRLLSNSHCEIGFGLRYIILLKLSRFETNWPDSVVLGDELLALASVLTIYSKWVRLTVKRSLPPKLHRIKMVIIHFSFTFIHSCQPKW